MCPALIGAQRSLVVMRVVKEASQVQGWMSTTPVGKGEGRGRFLLPDTSSFAQLLLVWAFRKEMGVKWGEVQGSVPGRSGPPG